MEVDYQVVVNLYTTLMLIGFPIGLVMLIAEKLIYIFQDFVLGKKRVNL